jgi:hypothetical protein
MTSDTNLQKYCLHFVLYIRLLQSIYVMCVVYI